MVVILLFKFEISFWSKINVKGKVLVVFYFFVTQGHSMVLVVTYIFVSLYWKEILHSDDV
jgi:hypothetical protein